MSDERKRNLNTTRIMVVEDNAQMRHVLCECLNKQEDMTVVGEAGNGLEALSLLKKETVDVMLMDIIMPQMDGYALLDEMNRMMLSPAPQVIAVTALGRDDFIMRAIEKGVKYYVVKPFEMASLLSRIRELAGSAAQVAQAPLQHRSAERVQSVDEKLSSLFLTIGIPAHIKGYQFLREAVKMVIHKPEIINRITKELYPGIAKHFNTSASKVERAIRHAIEVAWNRGRIDTLNRAFGCKVATKEDKPTNGEFIAMIADKLSLEKTA
jgi:Response regulator containing CheY-like receiver domain and AraC-type DNA-binding domain